VDESPWHDRLRRARRAQRTVARLARWLVDPDFATPVLSSTRPAHLAAELRVPIARRGANARLEAGKRHNVTLAATALDGLDLGPARPLSFWRAIGPATAARGYAAGMELRAGCAVPAIGGGICLVSNTLFRLGVELGWDVLERHAHTQAVGDILALDATVAFPHVDLRLRPPRRTVLDACVRGDVLVVGAWCDEPADAAIAIERHAEPRGTTRWHVSVTRAITRDGVTRRDVIVDEDRRALAHDTPTCLDCAETSCHARPALLRAIPR
jgi:hypothetical protein